MRQLILALAVSLAPVAALAAGLGVPLDQSVRIGLPAPVHDVIVGNPSIADVTVSDDRHLIVTGKQAGVTNLIVVSASGRTLLDRELIVGLPPVGRVSVVTSAGVQNYACASQCEQTTTPQDAMNSVMGMMGSLTSAFSSMKPPAPSTSATPTPSPMTP